jgi:hypothetical protein
MFTRIPSQFSKTSATSNPEINRLLSAAIVSRSFCSMLLNDPAKAIAGGYCGEKFHISSKTAQQVTAIHASTLADFATQLAQQ